ncbi:Like-Sm ribonucleoprotein (LSM) domain protein [Ophiocordyceps sinensis CO18]|uniref:Like-Sm ribonucleoprotein (LSM) domain protein n=1 Tax=Ophiocordyceps sinensis (strain Co18 / CGMCC 3.14243) TaxID=911162 RepID=T5A480_OPHSC|nr:Like-Sm ribonucleoprotein (LSM) domain protein [Ophiocordyceps sinensis CO18]
MSDRPTYRGGRGGGGGGGGGFRGGRGGAGARGGGGGAGGDKGERPKKENILDLAKYMDKDINVKFTGGREGTRARPGVGETGGDPVNRHCPGPFADKIKRHTVKGTLKGYDALMNLVLDDVQETVRDDDGNESTRPLGLVVARGTLLVVITPVDGSEPIANPFAQPDDES